MVSLDSNAISDILRGRQDVVKRYAEETQKGTVFAISDIAYYEVVRGLEIIGAQRKIREFMEMYEEMVHLPLDMKAINKAVEIYVSIAA